MKKNNIVSVYWNSNLAGRLTLLPNRLAAFEYDIDFIKTGISISPFYLPLKQGVFTARQEPFNGLFGVFNDSLPDGWGTLLTNRMLAEKGYNIAQISVLDRLCLVGNNGIGALSYRPEWSIEEDSIIEDYNIIAQEVEKVLKYDKYDNLSELYKMGGSSGGARPKIFAKYNNEDWIIKFKALIDPVNVGEIEYDYSITAKECGIEMSATKLFEGKYFGTKRFDIGDNYKIHTHSASGLLYASYRLPSLDYFDLMKATFVITNDINEVYKLFRLMVFNILTENRDDHAKNFSFICQDNKWKLSPAYDLVKGYGFNGQHTTTVLGKGNPQRKDIIELANNLNLKKNKIETIYNEIYEKTRELRRRYLMHK